MEDAPLGIVRSLGFDNTLKGSAEAETLFFVGPSGERSPTATDDALAEFLKYLQHSLETIGLYLANGKNPNTHEWAPSSSRTVNDGTTLALLRAERGKLWDQLIRWETLVREMRDARAHNLPKSFSEALDALVDELPKAVPDQRAMAIKNALDQIPLTESRRKMAEAGGDYIRNKMGLPRVNAAKTPDPNCDTQQDGDQNIQLADELRLNFWVSEGRVYESSKSPSRPATDQEIRLWAEVKSHRDRMVAVAKG